MIMSHLIILWIIQVTRISLWLSTAHSQTHHFDFYRIAERLLIITLKSRNQVCNNCTESLSLSQTRAYIIQYKLKPESVYKEGRPAAEQASRLQSRLMPTKDKKEKWRTTSIKSLIGFGLDTRNTHEERRVAKKYPQVQKYILHDNCMRWAGI